jgi:acetylornithine deacetylase/succinyl-diaminopimelate desuccinylase-like protein
VADFCEFSVDTRYLPGTDPKEVLEEIKNIVRSVTPKFKIEIDDIQYPYEISARHPLVQTYLKTAKKMGIMAHLKGSEGATVITFFEKKGIPAVATGYGSHGVAHITDEFVKINHLSRGSKLLEEFLREYDKV